MYQEKFWRALDIASDIAPIELRIDVPGTVRVVRIDEKIFLDTPILNSLVLNIFERKQNFFFLPKLLGTGHFLEN